MAEFTVRVELHNADADDYELLHQRMASRGYAKEVQGDNGRMHALPTAEYIATKNLSVVQVRDEVFAIAQLIKPSPYPEVLVTEANNKAWALKLL